MEIDLLNEISTSTLLKDEIFGFRKMESCLKFSRQPLTSFDVTDKKSGQKCKFRNNFSGIAALLLLALGYSIPFQANPQQPAKTIVQSQITKPQQIEKYKIPAGLFQLQLVYVPQLVGRTYDPGQLSTALGRIGLRLGNAIPVTDNQNIGIILSQSVPAREQVRRNSAIDITYGIASPQTQPKAGLIVVPNYGGIPLDEALRRIPNDSLTAGEQTEVQSDEPQGVIVAQFPAPETKVDPFTRVNLSFSAGRPPAKIATVPDLIGQSLQQAADLLQQAGLFAGRLTGRISNDEPGIVLDQSPKPGQQVSPQTSVDLVYSVQPQDIPVIIPDVTGLAKEDAIQLLHQHQLSAAETYIQRPDFSPGHVIQQDPLPGTPVPPGTEVQLVIAMKKSLPVWVYWIGGLLVAAAAGSVSGWKIGRRDARKTTGKEDPILTLHLIPDPGKQTLIAEDEQADADHLHLKIVPDPGIQTLKIDTHEI